MNVEINPRMFWHTIVFHDCDNCASEFYEVMESRGWGVDCARGGYPEAFDIFPGSSVYFNDTRTCVWVFSKGWIGWWEIVEFTFGLWFLAKRRRARAIESGLLAATLLKCARTGN